MTFAHLTPDEREELSEWWADLREIEELSPHARACAEAGMRRVLAAVFPEQWGVH